MSRFYYWFLELFLGILLASFFVFLLLLWTKHLALNLGFSYQDCFLPASHGFMFGMLYISAFNVFSNLFDRLKCKFCNFNS